ncbi:amino acid/polyamine transporter I [Scleroderma yunnanense]
MADEIVVHKESALVDVTPVDDDTSPGGLSFEEDTAGGLGRHLGVTSCTLLIIGRIIGTDIFSTPSSILLSAGSVGASLMLWVLGFLVSFCGLFIWLELGTMFPRSGGEKVYLEVAYKKPEYFVTAVYGINAIILGFTASGCIVFANNVLVAAGKDVSVGAERGIALGVICFVTILHGLAPRTGVIVMNTLTIFKTAILLFVVVAGWVVLSGKAHIVDPTSNFQNAFVGTSHSSNNYAAAMFKVLDAYSGWSNANYVLNNVRNPVRTLKIAGPLGLGICAVLYIFANIAYFSAATKEEILESGVTVADLFFGNVFGTTAKRALSVFVALRFAEIYPFSILLANNNTSFWCLPQRHRVFRKAQQFINSHIFKTFAAARLNQELAKEGIPLPFGNKFWASNWPTGQAPMPGLLLHLIPSAIAIIAPPMKVAFPFILDVQGYPIQFVNLFIVTGLFWLRWSKPHHPRPFKEVWWPAAVFYLASSVFLLVAPLLPPINGVGDTPPLPYYLYCVVGAGILLVGPVYWAGWRIVLPRIFGYTLVPRKETLKDGTVVTVFSKK